MIASPVALRANTSTSGAGTVAPNVTCPRTTEIGTRMSPTSVGPPCVVCVIARVTVGDPLA